MGAVSRGLIVFGVRPAASTVVVAFVATVLCSPAWPKKAHWLTLSLLAAVPALAASGEPGGEVSAGVSVLAYAAYYRPTPARFALDVAYQHPLRGAASSSPWSIRAGVRAAVPVAGDSLPLELFAQLQASASLGTWAPAAGLELGVSGLTRLAAPLYASPIGDLEQARVSPFYVAFVTAPLRLRFGAILLSAAELRLGTTLAPPGAALRVQLELFNLGVSW